MNNLDKIATQAVTQEGFEEGRSMCQRFVRQCVEKEFGKKFEGLIHQSTAREAALAFQENGLYVIPLEQGSIPGDLLYKIEGSGGFGHVGIRVTGNRVAENSVVHFEASGGKDGRGFRSLHDFGHFDLIVRLR
jgi:(p)ppGpp synthase/HD superfamily hydrolase